MRFRCTSKQDGVLVRWKTGEQPCAVHAKNPNSLEKADRKLFKKLADERQKRIAYLLIQAGLKHYVSNTSTYASHCDDQIDYRLWGDTLRLKRCQLVRSGTLRRLIGQLLVRSESLRKSYEHEGTCDASSYTTRSESFRKLYEPKDTSFRKSYDPKDTSTSPSTGTKGYFQWSRLRIGIGRYAIGKPVMSRLTSFNVYHLSSFGGSFQWSISRRYVIGNSDTVLTKFRNSPLLKAHSERATKLIVLGSFPSWRTSYEYNVAKPGCLNVAKPGCLSESTPGYFDLPENGYYFWKRSSDYYEKAVELIHPNSSGPFGNHVTHVASSHCDDVSPRNPAFALSDASGMWLLQNWRHDYV